MTKSAVDANKSFVPLHTLIIDLVVDKLRKDIRVYPNNIVEHLMVNLQRRSAKLIQDNCVLPEYSVEGYLLAAKSPDSSLFIAFVAKSQIHLFREHSPDGKYTYADCVVLS
ncbi:MAG: hypothetical protein UT37_C0007G0024 [Parcubacteria group bacterium GW2011_GWA2_39_18]|nr:MAG: hypothetical protein UT37_C0007G0024 [Parcubacteria group bacterium GW2011_GWA2_39_18]